MRVLALEPYHGGSHKAFLDGWTGKSRHQWTVLGLPPYKWKWRMRHAAITFADQVRGLVEDGAAWDVVFCSDMLNLAEFRGLASPEVRALPAVVYFHENQLTYPVRFESERDYHFVLTNIITALSADQVWFNSAYHRDAFLGGLPDFLKQMPDYHDSELTDRIRGKSLIKHPGVKAFPPRTTRPPGPLRILWAARWEHDKNPETFFIALKTLKMQGVEFRLNVIGEQFRELPPIFDWARQYFFHHIDRWGYQETREEYEAALLESDVFVSTANHEFFGITAVEAVAAGAYPLLPKRLAYPEVLQGGDAELSEFFYENDQAGLGEALTRLAGWLEQGDLWNGRPERAARCVEQYAWDRLVPALDQALQEV